MKPAMLVPFFLVVAAVAPAAVWAVYDINGIPIQPGAQYYFDTVTSGVSVTHSKQSPDTGCPQAAVLTAPSYQASTPIKFFPEAGTNYVAESTNVSLQFSAESWPCEDESKVWRVDTNSPSKRPDITTDGILWGEDSTFQIENVRDHIYKFVYCKTVSSGCTDIGVFSGPDGYEHLGLNGIALNVSFKKAND